MENNYEIFYLINGIIYGIFQLVTIVACGILFFKNRGLASGLMLLGSILSILFYGLSFLGSTLMAQLGTQEFLKYNAIINTVSQISNILFALGLLLFAIQYIKKQDMPKNI